MRQKIFQESFRVLRDNIEEHLNAINENSSEIQSLFDYLQEMEIKIDKVTARLDAMQIEHDKRCAHNIKPLNNVEKQVFLVLYTSDMSLAVKDLAHKVQMPLALVQEYVASLARKGIPVVRSFVNKQLLIQIDPIFKEKQAKENIVNLSLDTFF